MAESGQRRCRDRLWSLLGFISQGRMEEAVEDVLVGSDRGGNFDGLGWCGWRLRRRLGQVGDYFGFWNWGGFGRLCRSGVSGRFSGLYEAFDERDAADFRAGQEAGYSDGGFRATGLKFVALRLADDSEKEGFQSIGRVFDREEFTAGFPEHVTDFVDGSAIKIGGGHLGNLPALEEVFH